MKKAILCIDIGSTNTKVTAIDSESALVLGTASAYTTVETDVLNGLILALKSLQAKTGPLEFTARFACSSAAGGLRMIASGLAPSLTQTAAKMACLGAGAKVIQNFAYKLTKDDITEIFAQKPDIFLLVGGTDGGNEEVVLHNAKLLSTQKPAFPILYAGNRNAKDEVLALLKGWDVRTCENVMPRIEQLNATPVQEEIRALFLEHIIHAKGLSDIAAQMNAPLIPTPAAVLLAMELLADGTSEQAGIGELVAVDLGGATTDVYSIAKGEPKIADAIVKGIPEPYVKRTVEGDIGMRYSAEGVLEAVGAEKLSKQSGIEPEKVINMITYLRNNPDSLPQTETEKALDCAIAASAVEIALCRHAGRLETIYTAQGPTMLQIGKDLTEIKSLLLTGGAIIHNPDAKHIAQSAMFDVDNPDSLKPKSAEVFIDKTYILAAAGLLSQTNPNAALQLMKKELMEDGTYQ